jgi:hypothetical protein
MTRNFKKYLRNFVAVASLANGYWSFQIAGKDHNYWLPVIGSMLSMWVFYFSIMWLVEGLRSK